MTKKEQADAFRVAILKHPEYDRRAVDNELMANCIENREGWSFDPDTDMVTTEKGTKVYL
jgi:hypothetical protein